MPRPLFLAVLLLAISSPLLAADTITAVAIPTPAADAAPFYSSNRSPLAPSPFSKLPIGAITPHGWLRLQLQLEANGMTGHLEEVSHFVRFEGNAWVAPDGQGANGWEETPYWLKGYGDLGYVLKDDAILKNARRWIDGVLASQDADGYFGPRANKTSLDKPRTGGDGYPDLWPHMVMLNVLQSFYEATADPRVIPFMTRYFHWQNTLPPEDFARGYWPKMRFGDNIESLYWLYNRTGDQSLLDLARKIHTHMQDWTGVHNRHNVNIAQAFREPTVYFQQSLADNLRLAADRNYHAVMDTYGQFPGGGFAGDENTRDGYTDPHQGFETCGIVEFMHSFEMLTKITGDPVWSDRCEDIAFNSLPAAIAPDFKALHYLTAANQVQLDRANHSPGVQNSGNMFAYSPGEVYRCCQHNVSHGWPYYAEELWLATSDHGLCASLYCASDITAKIADGSSVTVSEETAYPFGEQITFHISPEKPAAFPLYLRIPTWARSPEITVNGQTLKTPPLPAGAAYLVINRSWQPRDTVTLKLPMTPAIKTWPTNRNAASVSYGPLSFSLKIGERWSRFGGTDAWPQYEVFPTTDWNFGLPLDAPAAGQPQPPSRIEVLHKTAAPNANPFTQEGNPIELRMQAQQIPNWKLDKNGLAAQLQPSPIRSDGPVQTVTLIPMGAARLRISMFPVISQGASAKPWPAQN